VEDGATVPIYYESRLARLALDEGERPVLDEQFEEATEGEALVGTEKRIGLIAEDIVEHFEQRCEAIAGKAMVVCMSHCICVELYRELVRLRPGWHVDDDESGVIKVVMTGSASDPLAWQPHIRAQQDGKKRCRSAVRACSQAFALAVPREEAQRIRDDVGFFQAVRAALSKRAVGESRRDEELDLAIRQITSRAVAPEGVTDIFAEAGLKKPDISVLSEEFLAEAQGMPQRNLAVELLQKLLRGEISSTRRQNVVQARSFAELLEQTIRRYQNRVIEELLELAREMRRASERGESLGLSHDEVAFYDALAANDSAVQVLGEETLREIARELVKTVRNNVTIDWTLRENVRANLRRLVRRILSNRGYPPDQRQQAVETVLEQAEALSESWATA